MVPHSATKVPSPKKQQQGVTAPACSPLALDETLGARQVPLLGVPTHVPVAQPAWGHRPHGLILAAAWLL